MITKNSITPWRKSFYNTFRLQYIEQSLLTEVEKPFDIINGVKKRSKSLLTLADRVESKVLPQTPTLVSKQTSIVLKSKTKPRSQTIDYSSSSGRSQLFYVKLPQVREKKGKLPKKRNTFDNLADEGLIFKQKKDFFW